MDDDDQNSSVEIDGMRDLNYGENPWLDGHSESKSQPRRGTQGSTHLSLERSNMKATLRNGYNFRHDIVNSIDVLTRDGLLSFDASNASLEGFDQENDTVQGQFGADPVDIMMENSDTASQSHRTGSTPSQNQSSSHTSASSGGVQPEMDGTSDLKGSRKSSSGASSLSSQPSPVLSPKVPSPQHPTEKEKIKRRRRASYQTAPGRVSEMRPRTSIPLDLPHAELARQSVHAAYASRLNPFALHPGEHKLLSGHICENHVTAYLNVRNRILRLWVRNPMVSVTPEEAAGCAYTSQWLGLAQVAYEWLLRRGYINFGCVDIPNAAGIKPKKSSPKRERKTVVVIGAGMAGLGAARQLEGLFSHYRNLWVSKGQEPPRIVVLEGRNRVGGRIYSHMLLNQNPQDMPPNSKCIAELGAHIVTGFDHGNPLNMIIRGQLALHYHALRDTSKLYDMDGKVVDRERDKQVEKLFNDILERASEFRYKPILPRTAAGDRDAIEAGRDPTGEVGNSINGADANGAPGGSFLEPEKQVIQQVTGGVDKLTGRSYLINPYQNKLTPAEAAISMGWSVTRDVVTGIAHQKRHTLAHLASSPKATLGAALNTALKEYQSLVNLTPQDLRLINWHYANLEYANAANLNQLSLRGWDQDIGNEFEGEHSQVIGGYQQVPRGLALYPKKLDIRTGKNVASVAYTPGAGPQLCKVQCVDGEVLKASQVILTAPLGVLKSGSVAFRPSLPSWKTGPIQRLGFGILNKVVLVFGKAFWDVNQDMVGLLRDSWPSSSLVQEEYTGRRGRCYLFWNCVKTSGRPVLIGLMAGDAAQQTTHFKDGELVQEACEQLASMYNLPHAPRPSESIVTRWQNDEFAKGTYSYVGPDCLPSDYDDMARPVGNLHFAGEATCGTHPATVHGAYISGLRAASEVIDDLLGPINIPSPLVTAAVKVEVDSTNLTPPFQASPNKTVLQAAKSDAKEDQARLEAFESEILQAIFSKLGPRPSKPGKPGSNPFLLFSKDHWTSVKASCDEARRAANPSGNAYVKASRNEVRVALGQLWREASAETKRPYIEKTGENRARNGEDARSFETRLLEWDAEAMGIRRSFVEANPGRMTKAEEKAMWEALGVGGSQQRRAKKVSGYADESEQEMEDVDV